MKSLIFDMESLVGGVKSLIFDLKSLIFGMEPLIGGLKSLIFALGWLLFGWKSLISPGAQRWILPIFRRRIPGFPPVGYLGYIRVPNSTEFQDFPSPPGYQAFPRRAPGAPRKITRRSPVVPQAFPQAFTRRSPCVPQASPMRSPGVRLDVQRREMKSLIFDMEALIGGLKSLIFDWKS